MKKRSFGYGAAALALAGMFACDTDAVPAGADTEDGGASSEGGDTVAASEGATAADDDSDTADTTDTDDTDDSGPPRIPVCGDGVLDPGEACDGLDFGDQNCGPDAGGSLRCTDTCEIDSCACTWEDFETEGCEPSVCGNGKKEFGESCDGNDIPEWDEHPCGVVYPNNPYGSVSCTDECKLDLTACMGCGDGVFDPEEEECDGAAVDESGEPLTCAEARGNEFEGLMSCSNGCTLDSNACEPTCGNGVLNEGEECDVDVGDTTCGDLGAAGGVLGCSSDCSFDVSACEYCGNGSIDGSEDCDGDALAGQTCADFLIGGEGTVSCSSTCHFSTSECQATGAALVISEIMIIALPAPLLSNGEWLELHNPHPTEAFSLAGCSLQGSAPFEAEAFDPELSIPPGGYLTFGEGSDEELGFTPDGVLAPQSAFLNEGDTIRIVCSGLLADEVEYNDTKPWPEPAAGVSIVLEEGALNTFENNMGASWCAATTSYAEGYFGTPGGPGGCAP